MGKPAQFQARDALARRGYALICFERRTSSRWDSATQGAIGEVSYELLYARESQIDRLRFWWQTRPYAQFMSGASTRELAQKIAALPDLTLARAA